MPWTGSAPNQVFQRTDGTRTGTTTWQQAEAADVDILSSSHDVHDQDVADGVNACFKRDGGNTAAANLPMGGFTLTNLGAATARTNPARFSDVQDGKAVYYPTVGGTADAITIAGASAAITAYAAGQRFSFINTGGPNTGAVTVNVDSVGAKDIKRNDGSATALSAGDMPDNAACEILYDGTRFLLVSLNTTLGGDLAAIEALSTTGIARRTGTNAWALDAGVSHLAATTADRLFGTNGAGASGLVTLSGLTLSAASLSVDAASDSAAGKIEIAVQSEMETGSSTTLAVTPARQRNHRSAVKAHGRVASNGTLQSGSYGISSVSRTGLGTYEVTLSVTMANTNYTVIAIGGLSEGGTVTILTNTSTTVITVQTRSSGNNALDDRSFAIMVLGDLA